MKYEQYKTPFIENYSCDAMRRVIFSRVIVWDMEGPQIFLQKPLNYDAFQFVQYYS
jgi:hypothetical protein